MLGAGALVLGEGGALAQSKWLSAAAGTRDDRNPLLGLPRHALVIGNASYKESPLRNPANDARAIAAVLKDLGFQVAHALEAGRSAMIDAIGAYNEGLAKQGAIGLFYFAGHGVQLAWRNYLIPIDAVVDNPDDVRERAVELNTLLQGLRQAKNPMNVIILDACRDNPFGTRVRPDHKGLSQFDAPPGSLLAYATAPGNVAGDGEGEHGLYTENLLREMKVPDAKIEDVFKRVRLHVRRRTRGQQIPWESTSLEEDFYFVPPKSAALPATMHGERRSFLLRVSQPVQLEPPRVLLAQAGRPGPARTQPRFEEQLAIWEKIRGTLDPEPLTEFLLRYPSGYFAELAQLRLDQALERQGEKKIQVVSSPDNPFSKGYAEASRGYKVGDSYTYRVVDIYTRLEVETFTQTITKITDREVYYDTGMITDLLGNRTRTRDGRLFGPAQFIPLEYAVGRRWSTRYQFTHTKFGPGQIELDLRIVARESITVPAGTFNAFRMEAHGWSTGSWGATQVERVVWLAPDRARRWIASEDFRKAGGTKVIASEREELVSYREA